MHFEWILHLKNTFSADGGLADQARSCLLFRRAPCASVLIEPW